MTQKRVTEAYKTNFKVLEYVCVTSQTRNVRATGAQHSSTRASHTLGARSEAIYKKNQNAHVAYTGVPKTKRMQRAPLARVERIRNVLDTHPGT